MTDTKFKFLMPLVIFTFSFIIITSHPLTILSYPILTIETVFGFVLGYLLDVALDF